MRKSLIKLLSLGLILLLSFSVISADIYAASTRPVLKYGMTGSQIKTLQVNLKKLGFFSSGTTGYYGDLTVSAVKKFQKKYDIPATGVVANLTYGKIDALLKKAAAKNTRTPAPTKSTSAPAPVKSTSSKPAAQPGNTNTQPTGLKRGAAGQEVTDLQNALRLLGYMKVSPTGGYGPITENAVYMLQKYYGLEPNGIADDKTTTVIGKLLGRSDNVSRGGDADRGDVGSGGANPGDAGTVSTVQGSAVQNIVEPLYAVFKQWIPGLPQIPFIQGVGKYRGVVIHYTASPGDNARTEADHERKYWYKAFVHEFIDPVEIIQVADPDYKSWGVGESGNDRFINLELCDASNQSDFDISFDKITERAAEYLFARQLGVTPAKADGTGTLWGHFQVSEYLGYTNHTDPVAYLAKWGKTWDDVVSIVTEKYNVLASGQTPEPIDTAVENTDGNESSTGTSSTGTSSAEITSAGGITVASPADGDF